MTISFAVQGHTTSREEWLDLAVRADELGFEALSIADHPGSTASPFVALAAAASVTSRLSLAPAVVNAGAWEPLSLAAEVATLDLVSDGRAVLGIGAGHTPKEWTQVGRPYLSPGERIAHLESTIIAVRALLAGEVVTIDRERVQLRDAELGWPSAPRREVPILVGGNASGVIHIAARHAETLELTGLGRTLPDGHAHEARWSGPHVDHVVQLFRASGGNARLGALVQVVEITTDRREAAEAMQSSLADMMEADLIPSVDDILEVPFVFIGTEDEIVDQLRRNEARWGITRYTTRATQLDRVAELIVRLG